MRASTVKMGILGAVCTLAIVVSEPVAAREEDKELVTPRSEERSSEERRVYGAERSEERRSYGDEMRQDSEKREMKGSNGKKKGHKKR